MSFETPQKIKLKLTDPKTSLKIGPMINHVTDQPPYKDQDHDFNPEQKEVANYDVKAVPHSCDVCYIMRNHCHSGDKGGKGFQTTNTATNQRM